MSLGNMPFISDLRAALAASQADLGSQFYGWKLTADQKQSEQSLMLGDSVVGLKPYQKRSVEDLSYTAIVYARQDNLQGVGSCDIDATQPLAPQIRMAFDNALMSQNPLWDMATPSAEPYAKVQTSDPKLSDNLAAEHAALAKTVAQKAASVSGVVINSAELFTNIDTSYMETSTGIQATQTASDVYFEIALEKLPLPNTQEVLQYRKSVSIDDANLTGFIDEAVQEALGIGETQVPKSQDNACILVDKHSIAAFLSAIEGQLNANAEYRKGPHMVPGDQLNTLTLSADSDQLTVTLDPFIPVMAQSAAFTSEGLPTAKGLMVEQNVVRHQFVDSRMSAYLNKPVNTVSGNMVVALGSVSKQQLIESVPQCIEILSFASLLVNDNTLTWSSEIKLGKLYENGRFVGMLKGGVVSGSIRENLSDFRLSNQSCHLNNVASTFESAIGYVGPNALLIKAGVKIAGN